MVGGKFVLPAIQINVCKISRLFFLNLNLASFLNRKALFLPVLMDIRQLVQLLFSCLRFLNYLGS